MKPQTPALGARATGLALVGLLNLCGAAQAQMSLPTQPSKSAWEVRGGLSVLSVPSYPGAKKSRALPFPDFSATYKDTFFIDFVEGVGAKIEPLPGLTLKASLGLNPDSRRAKDDVRFLGLKDIKEAGALNLALEYKRGDAFVLSTLRNRLGNSDSNGLTVGTDLGYNVINSDITQLGLGVHAKAMNAAYAKTFFSVSEGQSAASGLRAYKAGAGLQSAGVFAQLVQGVSKDWLVSGRIEVLQLRGDAANSPATVQRRQTTFIVSALRSF
jgi:MipA family protein